MTIKSWKSRAGECECVWKLCLYCSFLIQWNTIKMKKSANGSVISVIWLSNFAEQTHLLVQKSHIWHLSDQTSVPASIVLPQHHRAAEGGVLPGWKVLWRCGNLAGTVFQTTTCQTCLQSHDLCFLSTQLLLKVKSDVQSVLGHQAAQLDGFYFVWIIKTIDLRIRRWNKIMYVFICMQHKCIVCWWRRNNWKI